MSRLENLVGLVWEIHLRHEGLKKYRHIRGKDRAVLEEKASAQRAAWNEAWQRKLAAEAKRAEREAAAEARDGKVSLAAEKTKEVEGFISSLQEVLAHTLAIDDRVDWDILKDRRVFTSPPPVLSLPAEPELNLQLPAKPSRHDAVFQPQVGLIGRFSAKRRARATEEAESRYKAAEEAWRLQADPERARALERHQALLRKWQEECRTLQDSYEKAQIQWAAEKGRFEQEQTERNTRLDDQRRNYEGGSSEAVAEYCDLVLSNSEYPDGFPQEFELDYIAATRTIALDYVLPDPEVVPSTKEYRYNRSKDDISEVPLSKTHRNKLYDDLLYQVTLRTIHEVFEADYGNMIQSVVFNGWVRSIDPATGKEAIACVLSVQAERGAFLAIDLARVDPKACFKNLKGVGSTRLHSLTPVAPVLKIERDDKRFVASYDVVHEVGEGSNLAAMDWEDFEHLVREVFEKEFAAGGGEVRITRASRDAGVDAVVFDPDPIRGGKIVIQAKRYVNTVGVSAVRDLYGTVMNEGANKGILVSTAEYGPDAYEFAKGKPLTLLNGANLLHLLAKHGHTARIDLTEARKELGLQERAAVRKS